MFLTVNYLENRSKNEVGSDQEVSDDYSEDEFEPSKPKIEDSIKNSNNSPDFQRNQTLEKVRIV